MTTIAAPPPRRKEYLPEDFTITTWAKLQPYYKELLERSIDSLEELERWIYDRSELDALVSETFSWRYINVTVDSFDTEATKLYQYAVEELHPNVTAFENILDKKLVSSEFIQFLDDEKYFIYLRGVKNSVKLFSPENIELAKDIKLKSKEYGKIFSEMTIGISGKQMTLHEATSLLEETNRDERKSVYHKINQRILEHRFDFENLFDGLMEKRQQMAINAGFDNFRSYKFQALGRFDYSFQDCEDFHESIKSEIIPLVEQLHEYRKHSLKLKTLRPWDMFVDPTGLQPLKPCVNNREFIDNAVKCLSRIHPQFGEIIQIMDEMHHLDLDARKGKRHGGYNMPLHLTGVPFIFMNATNSLSDLRTLMHESGHAVHSYLARDFKLKSDKVVPSEVAELAAMTMELLSMEHWDIFFPNSEDLLRAHVYQLEHTLRVLPWIATIDKFQHWLYTNPGHTSEERVTNWRKILKEFTPKSIDHSGFENYLDHLWHKQLHIFEVPYYYIEYGMAQLGAIAIWKQYRENPQQTIQNYLAALKLGYTKPIGEIYETAGISFDFSKENVRQLGAFVKSELDNLLY